jgi:hypothetical protein
LVASLDSVFSIVGVVIPTPLDLYADICKPHPPDRGAFDHCPTQQVTV